jgi:hypothetical protein
MMKGATISECGKYRYKLWRIWDCDKPCVLFIMLNPSTADALEDDPTIRRCINFAKSWGYGGLYVGNLFAYRSTDPKELKRVDDPIGIQNSANIYEMFTNCDKVICAWGDDKMVRLSSVANIIPERHLYYLDKCKSGNPKHPLYLKKDLKPIKLY